MPHLSWQMQKSSFDLAISIFTLRFIWQIQAMWCISCYCQTCKVGGTTWPHGFFPLGHLVHDTCGDEIHMSSFMGRVSNAVIKWSNKGGRLSSKIMTTSPFFMGASKHVSWLARILPYRCGQACRHLRPSWWWRTCALCIRYWTSFWSHGCSHNVVHVFAGPWCAPTPCPPKSWQSWRRFSCIVTCTPSLPHRLQLQTLHNLPKVFGGHLWAQICAHILL